MSSFVIENFNAVLSNPKPRYKEYFPILILNPALEDKGLLESPLVYCVLGLDEFPLLDVTVLTEVPVLTDIGKYVGVEETFISF